MTIKDTTVVLRVEAAAKERIAEAARRKGKSMTSFIMDAAEAAAKRIETRPPSTERHFRGVPNFFRGLCATASQGGNNGYYEAGWHLGLHTTRIVEYDHEDEYAEKLDELDGFIGKDDVGGIIAWYEREFPRCMELVPQRRRKRFAEGVLAIEEERDAISGR